MVSYALVFFLVATFAAFYGIMGSDGFSVEVGYFLAVIAVVVLVLVFISGQTPIGEHGPLP
jgi:hypothetical protein